MPPARSLIDLSPNLQRVLEVGAILTPPKFAVSEIRCETVWVTMRDGVRLATDTYLPPLSSAPTVAMRTPYGRGGDKFVGVFLAFARRGFAVVSQDCRGTGDSEPDEWDYYMYEPEDGFDLVEWVSRQCWFDGFIAACGGSYAGQTQWHMAMHPKMTTIAPEVSGLGVAPNTAHLHMFVNAYARSVGKGADRSSLPYFELERRMLNETLATGYFNEPLRRALPAQILDRFPHLKSASHANAQRQLWEHYCSLPCAQRAAFVKELTGAKAVSILEVESLSDIFGNHIAHDAHTLPHANPQELFGSIHTPVLLQTGWYDWGINDTISTWNWIQRAAPAEIRQRCRLMIAPSAHNVPGYHEGMGQRAELQHAYRTDTNIELLLQWYGTVRADETRSWPPVVYYLMGANQWCAADAWPPDATRPTPLYLRSGGVLSITSPTASLPDEYTYDPSDPTPTKGGSIVSYVYPPGSVDVSDAQGRPDILSYTTPPLERDLDVVGPLRTILYASSSAFDTDFVARLSDVFPDGRAIQLQNGILRTRFRDIGSESALLEPGRVYCFEIDMWATANRFKAGHCIRLDISSADFPRFDRNSNRGGEPGPPIPARQRIYHDPEHPSHLLLPLMQAAPRQN